MKKNAKKSDGNLEIARWLLPLGLALLSGCGGAIPRAGSLAQLTAKNAAKSYDISKLQLVAGCPEGPSCKESSIESEATVVQGMKISYVNNIQLTKPLYFMMAKDAFSAPIAEASADYREVDPNGKQVGDARTVPLHFDPESERQYLSFQALFDGRASRVSPSNVHQLHMNFVLEGGAHAQLDVEFRVQGPLPQLKIQREMFVYRQGLPLGYVPGLPSSPSTTDIVLEAAGHGLPIELETLTNETDRPLALWARSNLDATLTQQTVLEHGWFTQDNVWKIPAFHIENFSSSGSLAVNSVRVYPWGGVPAELFLARGQAQRIPMRPHQTITLEWVARPVAGATRCTLPATVPQHFVMWSHPHPSWRGLVPDVTDVNVNNVWGFRDVLIEGAPGQSLALTDASASDDSASQGAVSVDDRAPAYRSGPWPILPAQAYSCQGLF